MKEVMENAMQPSVPVTGIYEIEGPGLLSGRAGAAIIYYLRAKLSDDEKDQKKGLDLLDTISDNVERLKDTSFANGLAGVGWAIEWLVQNKLLETNTDEVLGDFDDVLYKAVVIAKDPNISLFNGTLGKIAYFHKRLLSKNKGASRFRKICHKECLTMLTDDLDEKLREDNGILNETRLREISKDNPETLQNIVDIGSTLLSMTSLFNVNEPTVEDIFYDALKYTESLIEEICTSPDPGNNNLQPDYYYHIMYLSACYLMVSRKNKHYYAEKKALGYIEHLQRFDNDSAVSDKDNLFRALTVNTLLHSATSGVIYKNRIERLSQLINKEKFPFSVYKGAGGLFFAACSIGNRDLIPGWQELLFF